MKRTRTEEPERELIKKKSVRILAVYIVDKDKRIYKEYCLPGAITVREDGELGKNYQVVDLGIIGGFHVPKTIYYTLLEELIYGNISSRRKMLHGFDNLGDQKFHEEARKEYKELYDHYRQ